MSPTADGFDQSWGYADPARAAKAGMKLGMMYLSNDPSKNATPAKIKAYHQHGIGVLLGWETTADRALAGHDAGKADALEARRQVAALVKGVGYSPAAPLAVAFAVDFDTNPSQYPAIDAYFHGVREGFKGSRNRVGVYGEADVIEHLHKVGLTVMEWQTYAWSGGRLSTQADLYQFSNGQKLAGADVDLDVIEHRDSLGAWWPPGRPTTHPTHTTPKGTHVVTEKRVSQIVINALRMHVDGKKHGRFDPKHYPNIAGRHRRGRRGKVRS